MVISIPQAKKVLDALCSATVHPGDYDFGPAYEAAKERHDEAKAIMRTYIKDAQAIMKNGGRP